MRRLAAVLVALSLCACASTRPEDWTRRDTAMAAALAATVAVDAVTTSRLAAAGFEEVQPIPRAAMGAHPDTKDAALYFASSLAIELAIARLLPHRWRPYWLGFAAADHLAEGYVRNCVRLNVCP
jgi:hypothetical protein